MNGVLKTVWYFYVGGSGRLVLTLILLSIVLALFGIAAGASADRGRHVAQKERIFQ
jgi:hypothetical protein